MQRTKSKPYMRRMHRVIIDLDTYNALVDRLVDFGVPEPLVRDFRNINIELVPSPDDPPMQDPVFGGA